jgi:hypothetical protein
VTQALRVARRLARENDELRSHSDLVRELNAGLATHASVLHDRNLSLLARAREGFQLGLHTVRRLYDECDGLKADLLRVSEELETAKQTAFEGGQWKIKFDILTETTDEQTHVLQDELAQAKAETASFRDESAQAKAEVALLKAQLASRPVASDGHDLVPAHEVRSTRDVASSAAQEVDMLRTSRSTLETDLRRVTALLTAHAEEHQRDLAHIRELEGSVSRAESARVVADSARSEAEVAVLRVESQASSYRRLLQESRRHGREQARTLLSQTQRLESRMMELDQVRARASREHADQVADWRRLLRRARTGRESALRVRNALGARLVASVTQIGGTLDVDGLMRQLEREVEAAAHAAVMIPTDPGVEVSSSDSPAEPPLPDRPASPPGSDGVRRKANASHPSTPAHRSPVGCDSRSSGGSGSRVGGSSSSSRGSRRSRPAGASLSQVGTSAQRRSHRPTTMAYSAATASAAATAAASSSVAAASTPVGKRKRHRRLVESSPESSVDERPPAKVLRHVHTGLINSDEEEGSVRPSSSSSSEDTDDDESSRGIPFF